MKKTLLTYILLLCTLAAYPQVSVEALIDSTQMVVGEQTRLHVTASVRRGQQVTFSNWKPQDMLASGVEVVEASMVDTIDTGDGFLKIFRLLFLYAIGKNRGVGIFIILAVEVVSLRQTVFLQPLRKRISAVPVFILL